MMTNIDNPMYGKSLSRKLIEILKNAHTILWHNQGKYTDFTIFITKGVTANYVELNNIAKNKLIVVSNTTKFNKAMLIGLTINHI